MAITFLGASSTFAQSNTEGAVFGRILGASPAELAGATAQVSSSGTGRTRTVNVSSAGTFEVSGLPIGRYDVSVMLTGRAPLQQPLDVSFGTATARFDATDTAVKLDKFVVTGSAESLVDVASTEIGLNIQIETVKQLPVARDLTSVALLTPSVVLGDTNYFGNLASFGGASVGENAYYLNGFDITDFRRGLGFGTVPFEFFQEFQVKTTGYSAEFGRSTGGVVNTVSKRGSNEYKASASVYWEPASLRSASPDSFRTNGTAYIINSIGESENRSANLEFSGPIIKNKLFFYGLYVARDNKSEFVNGTNQYYFRSSKDPFMAAKVDWQITPDHSLEYTAFRDKSVTTDHRYTYALTATNFKLTPPAALGTNLGDNFSDRGGRTQIGRYSGRFGENFSLSAMFGKSTKDASNRSAASGDPYILNNATSAILSGVSSVTQDLDTRKAYRVDGALSFNFGGAHKLRFGYDLEDNKAHSVNRYSGDVAYIYLPYTSGPLPNNATPPAGTTQVVQKSVYRVGGDFRVITNAAYIEDTYRAFQDRLVLTAGLRNEGFDNRNGSDQSFIKLKNQRAPRLSASWDVKGDGLSKVFASWGRYFLQIPANTNVRLAGGELYYSDYYVYNGTPTATVPTLGAQVGGRVTTSNGIAPDTSAIVSSSVGAMYQDEFAIGYERAINRHWRAGVTAVYRNLKQVIEDEAIDAALLKYAKSKGFNTFDAGGFDYYVLTNPGKPLSVKINLDEDTNGDGVVDASDQGKGVTREAVTLDAAALGYPPATRKYYALEFKLDRVFDGKWFAQGSYVWSHDYGNYEGSVYSDIGQTDAGITQLFDQPGLVDGTFGDLPNDRRHVFKINGGYKWKEFLFTANAYRMSGRAINALGPHPTDVFAKAYGASSYYDNGILVPRGSRGRTPWVQNVDFSVKYTPKWGNDKLTLGFDLFNVFGARTVTSVFERAQLSSGAPDTRYKQGRGFVTPRYARFSASYSY